MSGPTGAVLSNLLLPAGKETSARPDRTGRLPVPITTMDDSLFFSRFTSTVCSLSAFLSLSSTLRTDIYIYIYRLVSVLFVSELADAHFSPITRTRKNRSQTRKVRGIRHDRTMYFVMRLRRSQHDTKISTCFTRHYETYCITSSIPPTIAIPVLTFSRNFTSYTHKTNIYQDNSEHHEL